MFLEKVLKDVDLRRSCFNFSTIYVAGKTLATLVDSLFGVDIDKFHTVEHLSVGTGLVTLAYNKFGGGKKGVVAGIIAASLFGAGWEGLETRLGNGGFRKEFLPDTMLDIVAVYAGFWSIYEEKIKSSFKRLKIIFDDEDLNNAAFVLAGAYVIGRGLNTVAFSLFKGENSFSVNQLVLGSGTLTLGYQKIRRNLDILAYLKNNCGYYSNLKI